jgi:hypothetical protein
VAALGQFEVELKPFTPNPNPIQHQTCAGRQPQLNLNTGRIAIADVFLYFELAKRYHCIQLNAFTPHHQLFCPILLIRRQRSGMANSK